MLYHCWCVCFLHLLKYETPWKFFLLSSIKNFTKNFHSLIQNLWILMGTWIRIWIPQYGSGSRKWNEFGSNRIRILNTGLKDIQGHFIQPHWPRYQVFSNISGQIDIHGLVLESEFCLQPSEGGHPTPPGVLTWPSMEAHSIAIWASFIWT